MTQTPSHPTHTHQTSAYGKLTPADALQLGSPATWAASAIPVFLGGAFALTFTGFTLAGSPWRPLLVFVLMWITATAAQAAVNTLNDYSDFKKGTDTIENSVDLVDVPILHKNLNPKDALKVGFGYMAIAGTAGLVVVLLSGLPTLAIGLLGAVILVAYSFGPTPISYLPISELVSGVVMGLLIPFATYYALTLQLDYAVIFWALPCGLLVGAIMQTNNTSDIERDTKAGRRTLPSIIGMRNSARLMALWSILSLAIAATCCWIYFPTGIYVIAVITLMNAPTISKIAHFNFGYDTRPEAMARASKQTLIINGAYIVAIMVGALN